MESIEDKNRWVNVYKKNCFDISETCKITGISESIIAEWVESDKKEKYKGIKEPCVFSQAVESIHHHYFKGIKNTIESKEKKDVDRQDE